MRPPRRCRTCHQSRCVIGSPIAQTLVGAFALTLLVRDVRHDLSHLHRIARGNFLEGYGQLIGRDAGEVLEHRPQLLQHLGLVLTAVAAPQNTVQRRGRSRFTRRVSGTLGIGEEDHSNEILGDLHDCGVYPRDLLRDLRLRLVGHKFIFGDSGVQRHSLLPSKRDAHDLTALGYKYTNSLTRICKTAAQLRFSAGLRVPVWNEDQLLVHKLFQAKVGKLFAITGALDSAEGQIRSAEIGIVDEDHARFHTTRDPLASLDV
jgi:hypothetical protein